VCERRASARTGECGVGVRSLTWVTVRPARNGGRRCPAAAASVVREQCALKPCVVNCVPGNLSACSACPTGSACGGESHTQTREVERAAANGGRECRPLVKYSRTAAEHC